MVLGTIVAAIGFFYVRDLRVIRDHVAGMARTECKNDPPGECLRRFQPRGFLGLLFGTLIWNKCGFSFPQFASNSLGQNDEALQM